MIILKLLGSIIVLVLFLMLIFISIGFTIIKRNIKFSKKKHNNDSSDTQDNDSYHPTMNKQGNKIFDNNEGEYIDFEEIKEDK